MGVFDIVRETIRDRITAFALTFVSPFIPREQKRSRAEEEENTATQKLGKFVEVTSAKSQSQGSYMAPLDLNNAPVLPMTRVKSLLPRGLRSQEESALAMIRVKSSLP